MSSIPQYYWDTCVFIAQLNDDRVGYGDTVDDISQFLDEAKQGKCTIHCSTITIAEITKDKVIKDPAKWRFSDFLRDFKDAVIPLQADVNIMSLAAEMRSLPFSKSGTPRTLGTPDAIHLASAIVLMDTFGVQIEAFHTFDKGGKGGVPLIGFETWCERCADDPLAKKVIDLKRVPPEHPSKRIPGT